MVKDVFIKMFHNFILNIQNKKMVCSFVRHQPDFHYIVSKSPGGGGVHCKMTFSRGEKEDVLNCSMIGVQDCSPM